MAPFAFLGPDYDDALSEFYTTTASSDIFSLDPLLAPFLGADALASTGPLAALIEQNIDAEFLGRIATEHGRGRRLYMGTVDLDSQRFVVWNMGRIAASDRPEALEMFRKVMLASTAIPIAFPPVLFEVEAGGGRYDEMHVDGAVGAHVFLNGGVYRSSVLRSRGGQGAGRRDVFVIHNGLLQAEPSPTPRSLRGIATRVVEATLRAGVVGDLFRIYAFSLREQAGFQWVTIAESVELESAEVFDPAKMRALYEIGYRVGREARVRQFTAEIG